MITLDNWAIQKDPYLPHECPKCSRRLDQIRFVTDIERMFIRATQVTRELRIHRALCPSCSHQLDSYTVYQP